MAGGIVGPVLLMIGLTGMPASGAALLSNAEGVFTTLLAWFVFNENFDRRVALGMAAIVAGAAVLMNWPGEARFAGLWPTLAVLGACFAWGIDNNLTRNIALADATWIASVKGLVSGSVNLFLAAMGHDHDHVHDEHHRHGHDVQVAVGTKHHHVHWHQPLTHEHPHFPDAHHRRHTH